MSDDVFTYEYLEQRGLRLASLKKYQAKTKIDVDGKPLSIGFPYANGSVKVRNLQDKEFYSQGDIAKAGLFGKDKFAAGSAKTLTITEGEYDAISLYQVLYSPVVSVQSASAAHRDCSNDWDYINSFERIYLAFDNDGPGREAAGRVASLFDYNKVFLVKFSNRKDANEYLLANESDELINIWNNARKFLPENIVSSLSEFDTILHEKTHDGFPYPWPTLTEMTYGIRMAESVLFTAQEGVGKTELMHAIEYKLLSETDSNVGAIYLEEPKRRHLQAIAGLYLRRPAHLPDAGLTEDQIMAALREVVKTDDRLHVYSHFGSDDPDALLNTIRFLVAGRSCRYIILDHITMAVSGLAGEDERRALDYFSTRLEMMVKELAFALLLVSHVNDFGQTRGSRYISKVADIRVDALRDVSNPDPIQRNKTYLTVSKNRFSGKTGPAGLLVFDPLTGTYTEDGSYGFTYPTAANDDARDGEDSSQLVVGQ